MFLQSRPSGGGDIGADLTPPAATIDPTIPIDGMTMGAADAPVTLEVYSDFQCPGCGQFARLTEPELRANEIRAGTLRIIVHDAAYQGRRGSDPSFDESVEAAAAARCAGAQGRFWDYSDWLFQNQSGENQGAFRLERLQAIATAVGLDMTTWQTCFDAGTEQQAVVKATNDATAAGVASTPSIVINGVHHDGSYAYDALKPVIAAAAAAAGGAPSPSPGVSSSVSPAASPSPGPQPEPVTESRATARPAGWLAPAIVILALVGCAISAYLLVVKLSGGTAVCPIGGGCETVQDSVYATILGVPVAALGLGHSVAVAIAGLVWWRIGDRRGLVAAYVLGILGSLFELYLVYLELFVIRAVCAWCVAYGVTVVGGLALAALAMRRSAAAT